MERGKKVASPLVALKNATVVFTVSDAGTTVDPDTGNVVANTTTVSYELFCVNLAAL